MTGNGEGMSVFLLFSKKAGRRSKKMITLRLLNEKTGTITSNY
jgi:hypothetical protein